MSLNILEILPPDMKVLDCANCGRLMAARAQDANRFRHTGLRSLGRYVRGLPSHPFGTHERPYCIECCGLLPGGGTSRRTEGQRVRMDQMFVEGRPRIPREMQGDA